MGKALTPPTVDRRGGEQSAEAANDKQQANFSDGELSLRHAREIPLKRPLLR